MSPWPVHATRVVYENPWIRVREDAVVRPDGSTGQYGVVEVRHTSVFVVAVTDADEVVMVTVNRHTVGRSVEVPAGGSDGQEPLVAAQRELLEETGWVARDWREVGVMNALNGICVAPEHVFLATGLSRPDNPAETDEDEGIEAVELVPWATVMQWVRDGRVTDGESVAALMYAALELGRLR